MGAEWSVRRTSAMVARSSWTRRSGDATVCPGCSLQHRPGVHVDDDAALKLGFLTGAQFDEWVRPEDMTHPLALPK
jgi:hypothetical protein